MSYAPSPLRHRREPHASSPDRFRGRGASDATARDDAPDGPVGEPYDEDVELDWQRMGVFGVGLAVGALLGAGAALLLAPQSGEMTRRMLRTRALGVREDARDVWEDLGDQLELLRRSARRSARRTRRRLRRGVTKGRWRMEDTLAI